MEIAISLNDLKFYAYHGVFEEETKIGNEFIVGLTVLTSVTPEMKQDDLAGTVSYADLYEIVKEEMESPKKLLEKVALCICERIKAKYPQVISGQIKIEKKRPPIQGMLGSASVALNFD